MPQIRPITDLRNTNEISDACHAVKEPIFITKNGYGDLVVMSIETYEQIAETQLIDNAITEAEEEYENYKICGYLFNQTEENWFYVRMEFVLVDAEGNDILIDGEPVVLQMTRDLRRRSSRKLKFFSSSKEELKMTIHAGSFGMFETDTIKAKDLQCIPSILG